MSAESKHFTDSSAAVYAKEHSLNPIFAQEMSPADQCTTIETTIVEINDLQQLRGGRNYPSDKVYNTLSFEETCERNGFPLNNKPWNDDSNPTK